MALIVTPTVQRNLDNVKLALDTSNALLIQGSIGCGKSASVLHLAEAYGASETMIQVNVDDTFDSKDLLGKFSATETPGTFEWVPGPLTTAVQEGYWILMEDIDLASFDVFSVLLSLLENGTLFISDKNRVIHAHPRFKLVATQQLFTSGNSLLTRKSNSVPYAELWGTVIMEQLPPEEVCAIVHQRYSNVSIETVERLAALTSPTTGHTLVDLRNLLRWSQRVHRRLPNANSTKLTGASDSISNGSATSFLSSTMREVMLKEAFDCFVARYPPGNEQTAVLKLVSEACGIPENVAGPIVLDCKPQETLSHDAYTVGRVHVPLISAVSGLSRDSRIAFAPTAHAMSLLERLSAAVECDEHVLLTGETGVGKTFIVQYLADQLGQSLIVHNLNQQTDTSDFMGGWKPLDVGVAVRDIYREFTSLFSECFNAEKNADFLNAVQGLVSTRKWDRVVRQILKGCSSFKAKNEQGTFSEEVQGRWGSVQVKAEEVLDTIEKTKTNFAFFFEEGSLVKAWREGHWILLDELNLASTEVLERVSSVLGDVDRLFLTDKNSSEPIMRHKNFHVFANMNPPTDVGKKDLPPSLRSRFVEFYVSEPFNRSDINIVVREYIGFLTADAKVEEITEFFLDCVRNAKTKLCALDGESKPPSFSLRTLTRALSYVRHATPLYGFTVALFDGLLLGFATPLQRQFHTVVEQLIVKNIFKGKRPNTPTLPCMPTTAPHIAYQHIWVPAGTETPFCDEGFILTNSVKGHLTNLARAVFAHRPVLLEGPTSSGKSSMVKYLAELTGNRFVRINNHDSTEVQEYLGHYVTDEHGKLRYVDGILVSAVRHGYWVVLDELNLAPTDVLEALNRLLDDNCELFIPDTQETIKPHPQLRIFATQNPAGVYGGRKMLSRAFRNRFLEITVDEIPNEEISTILRQRYALPESFAERMVEVMTALQIRRQNSQIFAGRHGFITPRDLFRWAERKPASYQELAEHGFLLLGERCRKDAERLVVKHVIESVTKTELDEKSIYLPSHWPFVQKYYEKIESGVIDEYKIVWTESMQRLFTIVGICLEHEEPVLLVGETGSSKTTVCQLWSALLGLPLHILNCHQHTEAADFLGSLRPVAPDRREQALFEWRNGPLVQSMIDGDMFVLDEISLAEDSVLERLNSVLEPSRSVTLAEKSTADCIVAHGAFRVMATMNPGGDFGKKELSPALRNRFTEIYVRPTTAKEEVALILSKRLDADLHEWAARMAAVLCNVSQINTNAGAPQHISIRDIIGWVAFMNAANHRCPSEIAFLQGLDAVILDGIGVGSGQSEASCVTIKQGCVTLAMKELPASFQAEHAAISSAPFWETFEGMDEPKLPAEWEHRFFFGAPATQRNLSKLMRASIVKKAVLLEGSPGVGKTSIVEALGCAMRRPVVRVNLSEQTDVMDLFGTYLPCPGVEGAGDGDEERAAGAASGPQFAWSDGVLLRALKEGSWVILDELNLASQSVLEGLNALLDHRSTVFIPELNEEFHAHEDFRIFACQNPLVEGGGRKGLPRSFLNRFIKVRIEAFEIPDLICITKAVCPDMEEDVLRRMVDFVGQLQEDTMVRRAYGLRGSPWEFNLRDVLRWAKLLRAYNARERPIRFAEVLFLQRMRTDEDVARCRQTLVRHFGNEEDLCNSVDTDFLIHGGGVYFGGTRLLEREEHASIESSAAEASALSSLLLLPSQASAVKALLVCAQQNQFALLVGPSGAGKTYALRTAAAIAGAKLVTFSINASCDTVDLLGGFDQVEGKQGSFEWRDSLVLEAMLQGHWLVLDNVNYCNASVLDRLNPLVEPNGVLSVNEQGLVNDEVRVIRPHPRFRLFATLNPRYGEISRAMRNRAVELYIRPVEVPSTDSMALCGHASSQGGEAVPPALEELPQAGILQSLARYHHAFVSVAFRADSRHSGTAQLSDALSAGAPSVFTLLRTSAMLRASSTKEDLTRLVLHRYVHNRCGHWIERKEELLRMLEDIVHNEQAEAAFASQFPALQHVLCATKLVPYGHQRSQQDEEEEGAGSAALEKMLVHNRVWRAALGLLRLASWGGFSDQHPTLEVKKEEEYEDEEEGAAAKREGPLKGGKTTHHWEDVLLHFVLEQCGDSVSTASLSAARRDFVKKLLHPQHSAAVTRTESLFDTQYTTSTALGDLFCRAVLAVGPHSNTLATAWSSHMKLTDSAAVNVQADRFLNLLQTQLSNCRGVPPEVFQQLLRCVAPFLSLVTDKAIEASGIHAGNYIPLVTQTALLLESLQSEEVAGAVGFAQTGALRDIAMAFLDSIQQHLELPFTLFGGPNPLSGYVAVPHITTAEERSILVQWGASVSSFEVASGSSTRTTPTPTSLLAALWQNAAFRAEFALIQRLLQLRTVASTSLLKNALRLLADEASKFVLSFTKQLPLFEELDVALWRSLVRVVQMQAEGSIAAVGEMTPLLISRFARRYGMSGVRKMFAGSWTAAAADCLRFTASVPVMEVGVAENSRLKTLKGVQFFLAQCPLSLSEPFVQWTANARRELVCILSRCFPSLPELADGQADTAYLDGAASLVAAADAGTLVGRQSSLFTHILQRVLAPSGEQQNGLAIVALLCIAKCRLLLPQSPIDPMYKQGRQRAIAVEEQSLLERLDGAFAWAEQMAMRHESPQRALLQRLRARELEALRAASVNCVARPDETGMQYATLVRQLYQICSTLLSDQRIAGLFSPLDSPTKEDNNDDRVASRETWSELLYEQVMDVLAAYGGYEDVTLNFAESALLASMAVHAACYTPSVETAAEDGEAVAESRTLFNRSTTLQLLGFPTAQLRAAPLPAHAQSKAQLRHHLEYLDSCLTLLQGSVPQGTERIFVEELFGQYRSLYQQVETLQEEERRAEEMAVLYKEKTLVIEGDDEKLLRKLKELFPSYEKEFNLDADGEEEEANAAGASKAESRRAKHSRIMFKEGDGFYLRHLVETHQEFYRRLVASTMSHPVNAGELLKSFKVRFDALADELHRFPARTVSLMAPEEEQLLLNGFGARSTLLQTEMRGSAASLEDRRESGFNIFLDTDVHEVGRFSKPLEKLLHALERLSDMYPDTVSLQRCLRIGYKVAALPAMSTPLMKVMAGCEVLLRECYEWERNASHDLSLMDHMTELSGFVLRWRRLELHCWSHVFLAKKRELVQQASLSWFRFYDLFMDASRPEHGVAEEEGEGEAWVLAQCRAAFEQASQYMWAATLGDFEARLRVLEGFGHQLIATAGVQSPLANTILHVCDFFAQFTSLIQDQYRKAVQPIEEDMKDFTKIMRWEDANYYAVRATAEKSHLKMARVLGSLEEALRTPVLPAITAEEQRCEDDAAMGFAQTEAKGAEVKDSKKKKAGKKEKDTAKKPAKRQRNGKAVPPTKDVSEEEEPVPNPLGMWSSPAVVAGYEFLVSSAEEVVQRVSQLQQPKTPNQVKVRALKSLFDTLSDAGVPHTHEKQVAPWEVLFATTEALLGVRTVHDSQPAAASPSLTKAVAEHYKFARWLQRMRDVERKPHHDLSSAQAKRGCGSAESVFSLGVHVTELVGSLAHLQQHLVVVEKIVESCEAEPAEPTALGTPAPSASRDILDIVMELSCQVQSVHGSIAWMLQEQQVRPEDAVEVRALTAELGTAAEELWGHCIRYEPLRRSGAATVPSGVLRTIADLLQHLQGVCQRFSALSAVSVAAPAATLGAAVSAVLHRCVEMDVTASEAAAKRRRTDQSSPTWEDNLRALLDEAGVAFCGDAIDAGAHAADTEDNVSEDGVRVYACYEEKCAALESSTTALTSRFGSFIEEGTAATLPVMARNELLHRLRASRDLVAGLQEAFSTVMGAQAHFGVVLARLFTVLMKKGFCKTEDEEENEGEGDGEQGDQQDGTGMDDGQGEKDVTDQIENEDQLMNMKDKEEQPEDQKQDKKDEGEDDDEDKAADVETDFQGNKEEREESEQEDGDEEGEESDKEMGDVEEGEEQERKKSRKDAGDDDGMEEDNGEKADEVPQDELAEEGDPKDEETGGFEDKAEEIRDAQDDEKDSQNGEHDLVGDENAKMEEDENSDDDDSGDSASRSDGEEREESDIDHELSSDDNEDPEEGSDSASENRMDDEESTDFDRSTQGEREVEDDEMSDEGAEGSDVNSASDRPDENIYDGGIQDEQAGEEATERNEQDKQDRDARKDKDEAAREEEQPGENQEQDEAGRNWKKQQEKNDQAQRRDNTEQSRSQHNPYRAIKEALQRHQRQMQQLNLNKHVEVKDEPDHRDEPPKKDEGKEDDAIEEFEFDEEGEREGMAATDEKNAKPTEAEAEKEDDEASMSGDESSDDEAETGDDKKERAPQDTRRKRKQEAEEVEGAEKTEDGDKKKSKRNKKKVQATAKEESEEERVDEEDEKDIAVDAQEQAATEDAKMRRGRELWLEHEAAVQGLSQQLCEQLRLILSPTLADKLQGDYKTGKRLNMKRIIPYIASQFKKDRIWLRRTKPNKRTYQIMVALDDSLSMQCNNAGAQSCRAVALIAKALQQLEVGEIGVACFGKETKIVHPLEEAFLADSGPRTFSEITFQQTSTNMKLFLETALEYLDDARDRMNGQTRSTTQQLQQIMFVISDGQITEDRAELRKLLARAEEHHQMVVFVLLDIKASTSASGVATDEGAPIPSIKPAPLDPKSLKGLSTAERMRRLKADRDARLQRVQSNSILDMQMVEFVNGKVVRRPYMEDFPFPYYLIVRDIENLPEIIADAMRQWFELLNAGV